MIILKLSSPPPTQYSKMYEVTQKRRLKKRERGGGRKEVRKPKVILRRELKRFLEQESGPAGDELSPLPPKFR